MPRTLGGGGKAPSKTLGRPGFQQLIHGGIRRGLSIQRVARVNVRRVFARPAPSDPSPLQHIGTDKDVLGSVNQRFNMAGDSNPQTLSSGKFSNQGATLKRTGVPNRSSNRRLKKS